MDITTYSLLTHLVAALIGAAIGSFITLYYVRGHANDINFTLKMTIVDCFHFVMVVLYLATLYKMVVYNGEAPTIGFTALVGFSFTSLAGDTERLVKIISAFRGK